MIAKLSTMTAEQKAEYLKRYEEVMLSGALGFKFLKPAEQFDDFGLRFPADYLNELDKSVVFLPLELMAEYVDAICKVYIDKDDKSFIFNQVLNEDPSIDDERFNNIDATAVGNLAYVCLNCKNEQAREICEKQLNYIFSIQKGRTLDFIDKTL